MDVLPPLHVGPLCVRLGQLGKIYETVTSVTPRLFKKFNYRIKWADNSKGPASLKVDNYAHGEDAALDSWVQLVRKEDEASASNS